MGEVAEQVREFIASETERKGAAQPSDNSPLLGAVLDSLEVLSLVSFLEERFEVVFDDEDLCVENLGTVAAIERLVESKRSTGGTLVATAAS